jgi:hypothetical protein
MVRSSYTKDESESQGRHQRKSMKPVSAFLIGFILAAAMGCVSKPDRPKRIQGAPITDQVFIFSDSILGKSTFIPTIDKSLPPTERLRIYVQPQESAMLHLPSSNIGFGFEKIVAVSFVDINNDGLQDIIIIGSYIAGIGEHGTEPFDMPLIYLRVRSGFQFDPSMSEQIAVKARGKLTINQAIRLFHEVSKQKSVAPLR